MVARHSSFVVGYIQTAVKLVEKVKELEAKKEKKAK
jgi:hypothetical protein